MSRPENLVMKNAFKLALAVLILLTPELVLIEISDVSIHVMPTIGSCSMVSGEGIFPALP